MNRMKRLGIGCVLAVTAAGLATAPAADQTDASPQPGAPVAKKPVKELRHFPEDNKAPGETCWKLEQGWFWKEGTHSGNAKGVMGHMATAHARYSNFLLNLSPDKMGRLEASSVKTLAEIGRLLKEQKE